MTRPIGTASELERRRTQAVKLLNQGESPSTIARILGVHETSVHRWRRMSVTSSLKAKRHHGRKPVLSQEQWGKILEALLQGATHYGWPNELWTAARVAKLIQDQTGVAYNPDHVRNILKKRFKWSSHKPELQAREQNVKEVERWKADEFPRIIREAYKRQATLVFLDESGFMLTPLVRRSLWPRGKKQIIQAMRKHDRISVISCITLGINDTQPKLYYELLPEGLNVQAENLVAFLPDLKRELKGPMTVVWDRHQCHGRARQVKDWLAMQSDVVLENLPPYAPKLNPDEMVWGWLKFGQLANFCPKDVADLREQLLVELAWASFDRELLTGFFNNAHLNVYL